MHNLLRLLCVAALCVALTPFASAQQRAANTTAPQRALQADNGQAETISNAATSFEAPAQLNASDPIDLRGGSVVLFSSGPLSNSTGTAQNGGNESIIFTNPAPEVDNTTFGYLAASGFAFLYEDFIVPNGKGWSVDRFALHAYQTGAIGTSTATTIDSIGYTIYPEDAAFPNTPDFANPILNCGTTADSLGMLVPVASVRATNVFRVTDTDSGNSVLRQIQRVEGTTNGNCQLSGGQYWVEWRVTGTAASGPWGPTVPEPNVSPARQCYGGNGLQLTADGFFIQQNGFCSVTFPIEVIGNENSSAGPINVGTKGGQIVVTDTTAFSENFRVPYTLCNKTNNGLTGTARYRVFLGATQLISQTLISGTVPARACVNLSYQQAVPPNVPDNDYRYCVQVAQSANGSTVAESCVPLTTIDARVSPRPTESNEWSVIEVMPWPEATVSASVSAAPGEIAAFPNPFTAQTSLGFSLAEAAEVRLAVYDVLGREVAVLVDGPVEAGAHAATFEARGLASGTYVYRLVAGDVVQSGRITLMN